MEANKDVEGLAREYLAVERGLRDGMRRRLTRRHKEGHSRMLEILQAVSEARPDEDPMRVVDGFR